MNAKKANLLFFSTVLLELLIVVLELFFHDFFANMSTILSLLMSQLIILIPTMAFLFATRTKVTELILHEKLYVGTYFGVMLYTFLCMPLIICVNAISLLFVDNAVNNMMDELMGTAPILVILMVGVIGPISEEFVFRGVLYHSYKKSGRIIGGMLMSAFLFGLTHMNFNQMSYAIVVGVLAALLVECTGSIQASMLFHMLINLSNVLPIYLFKDYYANSEERLNDQLLTSGVTYHEMLYMAISVYMVIAAVCIVCAFGVLYAMTAKQNRGAHMHQIWMNRKNKIRQSVWSVPLVVAVSICFSFMVFITILEHITP